MIRMNISEGEAHKPRGTAAHDLQEQGAATEGTGLCSAQPAAVQSCCQALAVPQVSEKRAGCCMWWLLFNTLATAVDFTLSQYIQHPAV